MGITCGACYRCREGPPCVVWAWRACFVLWWTRRAVGGERCCLALKLTTPPPLPSRDRRRFCPLCCRWQGRGKVHQRPREPSVWSRLGPPTDTSQWRLSARPHDVCRTGARPRRLLIATTWRRALLKAEVRDFRLPSSDRLPQGVGDSVLHRSTSRSRHLRYSRRSDTIRTSTGPLNYKAAVLQPTGSICDREATTKGQSQHPHASERVLCAPRTRQDTNYNALGALLKSPVSHTERSKSPHDTFATPQRHRPHTMFELLAR
jgi:hypothetical protein